MIYRAFRDRRQHANCSECLKHSRFIPNLRKAIDFLHQQWVQISQIHFFIHESPRGLIGRVKDHGGGVLWFASPRTQNLFPNLSVVFQYDPWAGSAFEPSDGSGKKWPPLIGVDLDIGRKPLMEGHPDPHSALSEKVSLFALCRSRIWGLWFPYHLNLNTWELFTTECRMQK